jgi:hypothetical protein
MNPRKIHGLEYSNPCTFFSGYYIQLPSNFTKAIAAVYRAPITGFERYLGIFATLGADRRIHLASTTAFAAGIPLGFFGRTAVGTALGFIYITFRLVKLLLSSAESEISSTIGTL